MIIHFTSWPLRCANCFRWFRRSALASDAAYCSYFCGAEAQPEHCASGWGFTSLGPRVG